MDFLSSNSQLLMEKSMGYLWAKQAAILDNIANAETPKYKAKVVTFEESIRTQLEEAASRPEGAGKAVRDILEDSGFTVFEAQEQTRMDDNGINVSSSTCTRPSTNTTACSAWPSRASKLKARRRRLPGGLDRSKAGRRGAHSVPQARPSRRESRRTVRHPRIAITKIVMCLIGGTYLCLS